MYTNKTIKMIRVGAHSFNHKFIKLYCLSNSWLNVGILLMNTNQSLTPCLQRRKKGKCAKISLPVHWMGMSIAKRTGSRNWDWRSLRGGWRASRWSWVWWPILGSDEWWVKLWQISRYCWIKIGIFELGEPTTNTRTRRHQRY